MRVKRDDRGVTLMEVLVAIVILAIIAGPLATGLYVFFANSDETTRRMSDSHDAQMLTNYFAQDVQSLGLRDWTAAGFPFKRSVETNQNWNAGTLRCGGSDFPKAAIRLAWDVLTPEGIPTSRVIVAYALKDTGTEKQLHRLVCVDDDTPDSDAVVVHNLNGAPSLPNCSPGACSAAPGIPQRITWDVQIKSPKSTSPVLTVTVSGQRRQT